jgi:hypothetical protein
VSGAAAFGTTGSYQFQMPLKPAPFSYVIAVFRLESARARYAHTGATADRDRLFECARLVHRAKMERMVRP